MTDIGTTLVKEKQINTITDLLLHIKGDVIIAYTLNHSPIANKFSQQVYGCIKYSTTLHHSIEHQAKAIDIDTLNNSILLNTKYVSSFYSDHKNHINNGAKYLTIPLEEVISIGLIEKHNDHDHHSVKNGSTIIIHYTKPTTISMGQGVFSFNMTEKDYVMGRIAGGADDSESITLNEFSYTKNQQVRARQEFPFNCNSTEIYNVKRIFIREDIKHIFECVLGMSDKIKFTSISGFEYEGILDGMDEQFEIFSIQKVRITFSKNGTIETRQFSGSMKFNTGNVALIILHKKGNGKTITKTNLTNKKNNSGNINNPIKTTNNINSNNSNNNNSNNNSIVTGGSSVNSKAPTSYYHVEGINTKEWYLYQDESLCDDLVYTLVNEKQVGLFDSIKSLIKNTPTIIYQLFEKYISLELDEKVQIDDNNSLITNIQKYNNNSINSSSSIKSSVKEYIYLFTKQRNIIQHKFSCLNIIFIIDLWKYLIEPLDILLELVLKRVYNILNHVNTNVIKKGLCEELNKFITDCKRQNMEITTKYNQFSILIDQEIHCYKQANESHKNLIRKLANVELPSNITTMQTPSIQENVASVFKSAKQFIGKYQIKKHSLVTTATSSICKKPINIPTNDRSKEIVKSRQVKLPVNPENELNRNIKTRQDLIIPTSIDNELSTITTTNQQDSIAFSCENVNRVTESNEIIPVSNNVSNIISNSNCNHSIDELSISENLKEIESSESEIIPTAIIENSNKHSIEYDDHLEINSTIAEFPTTIINQSNTTNNVMEETITQAYPIQSSGSTIGCLIGSSSASSGSSGSSTIGCSSLIGSSSASSGSSGSSETIKIEETLNSRLNNFINYEYTIKPEAIEYNFKNPFGIYIHNNIIYITDRILNIILKIDENKDVQPIGGISHNGFIKGDKSLAINCELNGPSGICVSPHGEIYFSDTSSHRICKINLNGKLEIIAGNGKSGYNGDNQLAIHASLKNPQGICMAPNGELYFTDTNRIRKITLNGVIETIAGIGRKGFTNDGELAINAKLDSPTSIWYHENEIYFSDNFNNRIRKIDFTGRIKTIVGGGVKSSCNDNIIGLSAMDVNLNGPDNVYINSRNEILVSDTGNHRVLKISKDLIIQQVFDCELKYPNGVFENNQNQVFIVDTGNKRVLNYFN